MQPPMSATISTGQGTVMLQNSTPREKEEDKCEDTSRKEKNQLLASILQLRQAQRLIDELLVVHVHPTKPEESSPADPLHPSPGVAVVLDEMVDVFAPLLPELTSFPTRKLDFRVHVGAGKKPFQPWSLFGVSQTEG
jgi:hypothetical protein